MLHITDAKVVGPFQLELAFSDGLSKSVNVRPLLTGPVFEPLLDPEYFAQVTVDRVCRNCCVAKRC